MKAYMADRIHKSIAVKERLLSDMTMEQVEQIVQAMIRCFKEDGTIYFCGNGGSNADAQHIATELSGRFYKNRKPLSAICLGTNPAFLTAVANDINYEEVYARELEATARKGDLLIAISTSGRSKNVLNAVMKSKSMGVKCIGITGNQGHQLMSIVDHYLEIPSSDVPRIQEAYMLVLHNICEYIEHQLFS